MCTDHPGFDSDVTVRTEPVALMRVFSGLTTLRQARATGAVALEGVPRMTREFPTWFLWSPFAPAVRDRMARTADPA